MNIFLDNVNINSRTGPNHFGKKLIKYLAKQGHSFHGNGQLDAQLSFIERKAILAPDIPVIQRLDGIYFDPTNNYKLQNKNILKTYEAASGVVFQSEFSKNLVSKHFGEHENYTIIHNGADLELIDSIEPVKINGEYDSIWCCASHWRPFKRLSENIRYFLEFSSSKDILIVCGNPDKKDVVKNEKIIYTGEVDTLNLLSIFKAADYFVHLGRYDNCPNVVVDSRACGCEIICASVGGTREVAGENATIILEDEWQYEPESVNEPRPLDFTKTTKNRSSSEIDINITATKYSNFIEQTIKGIKEK